MDAAVEMHGPPRDQHLAGLRGVQSALLGGAVTATAHPAGRYAAQDVLCALQRVRVACRLDLFLNSLPPDPTGNFLVRPHPPPSCFLNPPWSQ